MTTETVESAAAAAYRVADLRAFLAGDWAVARTIADRRTGQSGTFEGRAQFAPEGAGLTYHEEGRLALGAFETIASQLYRYRFPTPRRAAASHRP